MSDNLRDTSCTQPKGTATGSSGKRTAREISPVWLRFETPDETIFDVTPILFTDSNVISGMLESVSPEEMREVDLREAEPWCRYSADAAVAGNTVRILNTDPISTNHFNAEAFHTLLYTLADIRTHPDVPAWSRISPDVDTILQLSEMASYFGLPKLMEAASDAVGKRIRGLDPQSIRELFEMDDDFALDEHEQVCVLTYVPILQMVNEGLVCAKTAMSTPSRSVLIPTTPLSTPRTRSRPSIGAASSSTEGSTRMRSQQPSQGGAGTSWMNLFRSVGGP